MRFEHHRPPHAAEANHVPLEGLLVVFCSSTLQTQRTATAVTPIDGTHSLWTHSRLADDYGFMVNNNRNSSRFGDAVRRARAAAGLTQEELAERAGLERSYIGGVERGDRNPTLIFIEKIAEGLDIDLAELFSYSARKLDR